MEQIREKIVNAVRIGLEADASVHAFWLEGSDGFGELDEFSDLDLWLDVEKGTEGKVFKKIERALSTLSPIDFVQDVEHPHPQIQQRIYHLKGTSEYLLLDICIQSHDRKFSFVKGHKYEVPKVIFDKSHVIRWQKTDTINLKKAIKKRVHQLKLTFAQQSRTKKYIHRGRFLEALAYYHKWIMVPLVELLRIQYAPLVSDYHLVKISHDLPKGVLLKVENLYRVNSVEEIREKMKMATKMFKSALSKIEKQY
jgi:hypothetical protein